MRQNLVRDILEAILNFLKSRAFVVLVVFGLMFSVLLYRVFYLQIVKSDYYLNNYLQIAERTVTTSGTRGLIYDRNGIPLASNQLAYTVTIEDNLNYKDEDYDEKLNEIIYNVIRIVEQNGDVLNNDFSIILGTNGEYMYSVASDTARLRFLRDIYGKKSIDELDSDKETLSTSTAEDVMKYLCGKKRFNIDNEKYTKSDKLKIAIIRYNLSLNSFQKYMTTEIANNVNDKTVAAIYENAADLTGVQVTEKTQRVYNDSVYFAHILGYTGTISEDQLAEFNMSVENKDDEYISSDVVGKSGIEQYMEKYLQGSKGYEKMFVDSTGNILEVTDEKENGAGNDVYLTLDANLQKAAYNILEQKLAGILYSKIVNYEVHPAENAKTIPIYVRDVYAQMICNNVVDLNKFGDETASSNEQRVNSKFASRQTDVLSTVQSYLTSEDNTPMSSLSEENNTYLTYIYNKLSSEQIIDKSAINTDDETYKKWKKESISLKEFLLYAISQNWISSSKLYEDSEQKYSSTDEIYAALVNHIFDLLPNDTDFSKKIYYYLIENGTISGNEVCMLLFDQGVLEYDENAYNQLASGNSGYAYNFILQQIKDMKITPAQVALDPCSASVVITDVNSGQVLALVTYPSYDNNKLSGSVDAEYWKKLNDDQSLPLYNRATQTRTAPGSTFKMITAITGLENGIISPGSTIVDRGEFTKITPSPKCWKYPSNHGAINVSQALAFSCNYFFYEVGYELSIDSNGTFNSALGLAKIKKYADELGLTSLSGVEIDENEPLYSTDNSVRSAIGQGSNSYSDIQLARYITSVANSGNNYKLTLLNKVLSSSGDTVESFEPVLANTTDISSSTWNAVHNGMRQVIVSGTAKKTFDGFNIEVAGKTGTAQENKLRSNHSVFVAYAPYSNPEIGISVLIPNGESTGYTAEIVRDIVAYYYNPSTLDQVLNNTAAIPTSGVSSE